MIELMFLKVLMLIRQVHQECIICHYWKFLNGSRDVLMMSIDINSIAILNIHVVDYFCIINGIMKIEAINLYIPLNHKMAPTKK